MLRFITVILMLTLTSTACFGSEGDKQANSFFYLYSSLCLKNLVDLDALREKLKPVPKFPPEHAALFLGGRTGDAWPVPDEHGTFVLALLGGKNFCALHARRANTETVTKLFTELVAHPPAPFIVKQLKNEQVQTAENGMTYTVSYEWSLPDVARKLMFTLTTAPSESAQLQVLGSAAIIQP